VGLSQAAVASLVDLVGVAHLDTWEAQIGRETKTSEALVLVEWLPDREVTIALIDLPSDQRVVLSRTWRIKDGVSVFRLVDDATGWWAEVTETSTLTLDSIDQVAQPAAVAKKWAAGHQLSVEVAAAGAEGRPSWSSSLDDAGLYSDMFEQVDAEGFAARMVRGMPTGTRQSVRSLDSLLSAEPEDGSLDSFQRLVALLAAGLDRHGDAGVNPRLEALEWKLVNRKGESLKAPLGEASRRFAGRFRSLPGGDPLALLCTSSQEPGR
jgi:hypothetical protein